jgi:archaellum component FlaC
MDRILGGTPQHSSGALTIVALAQEAGVPRNALTQRHLDLKNEFYQRIQARGDIPDVETRLRATITTLKQTIANKNDELDRLRADLPALVRAVHLLTLENNTLRETTTRPHPNVITIGRKQPHQP